jgi:CubicO group peptidase (beta-lactamase class C family)
MTGCKHPSPTTGTFRKRSPKRGSARPAHVGGGEGTAFISAGCVMTLPDMIRKMRGLLSPGELVVVWVESRPARRMREPALVRLAAHLGGSLWVAARLDPGHDPGQPHPPRP